MREKWMHLFTVSIHSLLILHGRPFFFFFMVKGAKFIQVKHDPVHCFLGVTTLGDALSSFGSCWV